MPQEHGPTYSLEIRAPGQAARRLDLSTRLTVGKSSECDLSLDGVGIAPVHCVFKLQNDLLSVHHLAQNFSMALDKQELGPGRMYILDKGDRIVLGDHELVVRKEEVLTARKKKKDEAPGEEEAPQAAAPRPKLSLAQGGDQTSVASLLKKAGKDGETTMAPEEEEDGQAEEHGDEGQEADEEEARLGKKTSTAKKKTGLLARLFNRSKSPARPQLKIKKKIGLKSYATPPGVGPRAWSMTLDWALVYAGIHFVIPFFELEKERDQVVQMAIQRLEEGAAKGLPLLQSLLAQHELPIPSPVWEEIPKLQAFLVRPEILVPVLIFAAIQLLGHLLAGTSFGLYLMGTRSDSSFLSNRPKALIRCLVGFATLPFLIFDLPALFGKRTFKEFITLSDLEIKSKGQKIFGSAFLVPVLMLACILSPLFFALEMPDGIPVSEAPLPAGAGGKTGPEDIPFKGMPVPGGARLDAVLPAGTLAWFEAREGERALELHLASAEKGAHIALSWPSSPNLKALYDQLPKGDPLFEYLHPSAEAFIESGANVPNAEAAQDLAHLARSAMALGAQNFPEHLLAHGPFVNGQIQFRRQLLAQLSEGLPPAEAQMMNLSGSPFLALTFTQDPMRHRRLLLNLALKGAAPFSHWEFSYKAQDAAWAQSMALKLLHTASFKDGPGQQGEEAESPIILNARALLSLAQGQTISAQHEEALVSEARAQAQSVLSLPEKSWHRSLAQKYKREVELFTKLKETANTEQLTRITAEWSKIQAALEAQDPAMLGAQGNIPAPAATDAPQAPAAP